MHDFLASGMPWQIFNFVVFVVALAVVLRKPVRDFWASRSHEIRFQMEESGKKGREARERYESARRRVAGIEREGEDLIRLLEREAELEKNRMIEEAERVSRRLQSDNEKILAQEIRKAREGLRSQVVELSIEMAERLVHENLGGEDQRRLSDRYLSEVERGAA